MLRFWSSFLILGVLFSVTKLGNSFHSSQFCFGFAVKLKFGAAHSLLITKFSDFELAQWGPEFCFYTCFELEYHFCFLDYFLHWFEFIGLKSCFWANLSFCTELQVFSLLLAAIFRVCSTRSSTLAQFELICFFTIHTLTASSQSSWSIALFKTRSSRSLSFHF